MNIKKEWIDAEDWQNWGFEVREPPPVVLPDFSVYLKEAAIEGAKVALSEVRIRPVITGIEMCLGDAVIGQTCTIDELMGEFIIEATYCEKSERDRLAAKLRKTANYIDALPPEVR